MNGSGHGEAVRMRVQLQDGGVEGIGEYLVDLQYVV